MLLSQQTQTILFGEAFKAHRLPKTQYLGSKERLVKWIFDNAPKNIEIFLDGFSGTSVVGYYFKNKGKKVIVNDFLKFNFHIGKALIKNKNITLDDNDIALILSQNKKADFLIESIFTDVFFERDQASFLDNFRANIDLLDNEYKKSLALAVMNRALTRKVLLGHFAHLSALRYSKDPERVKRNPTIARPLKDLFLELVPEYNDAVFDNEKDNEVYCEDTIQLIPKLKNVDLVYFDPPYCGCHPDYQAFYHFLETFVEYWKDKEFINGTKQYFPKKESGFVRKEEITDSFKKLFSASSRIPNWLISYNSESYPEKETMMELIGQHKKVKVFEHEYQNPYGGKGSKKGTKEYLFYCYE
ncbi:MAG: DNA adenine methylase [Elusimicrobiota bacterium]